MWVRVTIFAFVFIIILPCEILLHAHNKLATSIFSAMYRGVARIFLFGPEATPTN